MRKRSVFGIFALLSLAVFGIIKAIAKFKGWQKNKEIKRTVENQESLREFQVC